MTKTNSEEYNEDGFSIEQTLKDSGYSKEDFFNGSLFKDVEGVTGSKIEWNDEEWQNDLFEITCLLEYNGLMPSGDSSEAYEAYLRSKHKFANNPIPRIREDDQPTWVTSKDLAIYIGFSRLGVVRSIGSFERDFPDVLVPKDEMSIQHPYKEWDLERSIANHSRLTKLIAYSKYLSSGYKKIQTTVVVRKLFGMWLLKNKESAHNFICMFNMTAMACKDAEDIDINLNGLSTDHKAHGLRFKKPVSERVRKYLPYFNHDVVLDRPKKRHYVKREEKAEVDEDGDSGGKDYAREVKKQNARKLTLDNDVNASKSIYVEEFSRNAGSIMVGVARRIDAMESTIAQIVPDITGSQSRKIKKMLIEAKNEIYSLPRSILGALYSSKIQEDISVAIEREDAAKDEIPS